MGFASPDDNNNNSSSYILAQGGSPRRRIVNSDGRSSTSHSNPLSTSYSSSWPPSEAAVVGERGAASAATPEGASVANRRGTGESEAWSSSVGVSHLGDILFGAGTGGWGLESSGVAPGGRGTGSRFGRAGCDAEVLERRAEAAHEQSDFWERRARSAEEKIRGLEIVRQHKNVKYTYTLKTSTILCCVSALCSW